MGQIAHTIVHAGAVSPGRKPLRLGTQLLVLLLAFGAIPLAAVVTVGYMVSRTIILGQAERALQELGRQQAVHLSTELTRERLILRTILGHLPSPGGLAALEPGEIATRLAQSLPEDGVFDGLRLVTQAGDVVVSVALRNTAPHWPTEIPAAAWARKSVAVHWVGDRAVAYVLAVALGDSSSGTWLEGHVRASDFGRLFAIPTHLMGEVESVVLDANGRSILVSHAHTASEFPVALGALGAEMSAQRRIRLEGAEALVVAVAVPSTNWTFAAALPLATALAPLAGFRDAAILATTILTLLIGATAVVVTRSMSTPLRQLASEARRFGRGEPHRPVQRSGTAEVRLLVDAFDQMAEDLRQSRVEIDRLHERDMERAQQLATVGEMASGIAHEVRNPLTGVLGALELILKDMAQGEPTRPLLEEAQQQLRRIESTTSQLLRYARPPELREVVVDPTSLVERAARVVEPQARTAGVGVRIEPESHPVAVRVDSELMVQVLVNLMLNGIDALDEGAGLSVWLARRPPEIWIGVRDVGPGVPADVRSEIFRPFYTTKSQGTGLGLPISHQIVERHGGRLWLEETPGGGATFVVALPLVNEEGMTGG
jgi:signal transduction histidine kinase